MLKLQLFLFQSPVTKRISTLLLAMAALLPLQAQTLNELDIRVVLQKNGDARITETRQMTITNKGTECYIGLGNMGASEVKDLTVSDETGTDFRISDSWGAGLTRENKTHRCAIVERDNGVTKLCWGLGASGERTYITSYTITGLVRGYSDADAIRHIFLGQSVSPKPAHAKVTIMGADTTLVFTPDTCGVWGFRFMGDLKFEDGRMVAETTEAMNAEAALYIMAMFPKGMFEPTITENDTFEHKKLLALMGSDYLEDEASSQPQEQKRGIKEILLGVVGVAFLGWCFLGGPKRFWNKLKGKLRRERHEHLIQSIDYYRDIPLEGNLQQANDMLNAFEYTDYPQYQKLLSATVLQLVHMDALSAKPVMTEAGELNKRFVINKRPDAILDHPLAYRLHELFEKAAGENRVLDPNELDAYMKDQSNRSHVRLLIDTLCTSRDAKYYDKHQDEVRQVYGFRKFLNDFTLMNERHLTEVKLWKDYMVWATLYGNADQVVKDMKAINPEFFNLDAMAGLMVDSSVVNAVSTSVFSGTDYVLREIEKEERENRQHQKRFSSSGSTRSRSSGGGGRSSRGGGGGGFSGGGGGGIR